MRSDVIEALTALLLAPFPAFLVLAVAGLVLVTAWIEKLRP